MSDRADVTYCYDGTFDGLLCCVFEAFDKKETPVEIRDDDLTLFAVRHIETDGVKAERVLNGIHKKIGGRAFDNVRLTFLSGFAAKELAVLKYLRYGFRYGRKIYTAVANEAVAPIMAAVKSVYNEAHKMKEFVRFTDYGSSLVSVIEPTHNVLPLIADHFCDRLPQETFMIYDKGRGVGFVHAPDCRQFITLDELELPPTSEEEKKFRKLWKLFYDTVEIKERHSDRGRMNHCPKHYWRHMTEFQ